MCRVILGVAEEGPELGIMFVIAIVKSSWLSFLPCALAHGGSAVADPLMCECSRACRALRERRLTGPSRVGSEGYALVLAECHCNHPKLGAWVVVNSVRF